MATDRPTCTHCGTTRQVFKLLDVHQCWSCYYARTAVRVVLDGPRAPGSSATSVGVEGLKR
jgi:hypothetical protein